ncbi:MAG: D-Ala-D-Ala carboxypeptidase family metallohydrolase [Bacteroidales bacterium]|nr:D-Ala-D-Ala carboxypeptidase family metallohydrolase [Bacteroidales bacterium]
MPDINSLDNMLNLIVYCLQPLRDKIGKPFDISSGYRCSQLNKLVGGKSNSQHLTGQAIDFKIRGLTVSQGIELIKNSGIEYDQLLDEYDKWIHLSFNKGKNRKEVKRIR